MWAALIILHLAGCTQAARVVSDKEVERVHRSAILIDTHNDVTSFTVKGEDIGGPRPDGHTDIPRLRQGGVGAVFFAVYVGAEYVSEHKAAHRALEMVDTVRHDIVARHQRDFTLATSADEIEAVHRDGKIAALLGIEGGHAIEDSLRLLRDFYALGVRYMTLTHANTNHWADSSGDAKSEKVSHHNGLTPFGRQVVAEMNRLGMMVDISHVSDKTFYDVLQVSRAPVIASHSGCRAVADVPRNMTDDMIRLLAKHGGVIQINFGCEFVSPRPADPSGGRNPKTAKHIMPATLAGVVAQIDHAVKVAGADHVGIGTDFDGVSCVPAGLEDVSKFPALTRALLEHGYRAEDIRKIYGGNTLRLMRAVEKAADKS